MFLSERTDVEKLFANANIAYESKLWGFLTCSYLVLPLVQAGGRI